MRNALLIFCLYKLRSDYFRGIYRMTKKLLLSFLLSTVTATTSLWAMVSDDVIGADNQSSKQTTYLTEHTTTQASSDKDILFPEIQVLQHAQALFPEDKSLNILMEAAQARNNCEQAGWGQDESDQNESFNPLTQTKLPEAGKTFYEERLKKYVNVLPEQIDLELYNNASATTHEIITKLRIGNNSDLDTVNNLDTVNQYMQTMLDISSLFVEENTVQELPHSAWLQSYKPKCPGNSSPLHKYIQNRQNIARDTGEKEKFLTHMRSTFGNEISDAQYLASLKNMPIFPVPFLPDEEPSILALTLGHLTGLPVIGFMKDSKHVHNMDYTPKDFAEHDFSHANQAFTSFRKISDGTRIQMTQAWLNKLQTLSEKDKADSILGMFFLIHEIPHNNDYLLWIIEPKTILGALKTIPLIDIKRTINSNGLDAIIDLINKATGAAISKERDEFLFKMMVTMIREAIKKVTV